MPIRHTLILILTASALVLSGCQATQQERGRVIGSVLGGVLGSQGGEGSGKIALTIAGAMLGGYLGGEIGRQMDENDRYRANEALETVPTHQSTSWDNPDNGNHYRVTPTRTYYEEDTPCREYTTEAWIGGKRENIYGTACRRSDGSWEVVGS